MKIENIRIVDFTPRFPGDGYVMSHITQTVLHARLIRLETDEDHMGYGEIVRRPLQDPEETSMMEDQRLPALEGLEVDALPRLLDQWRLEDGGLNGLAFGVETAFLDLVGRASGTPVSTLLGGQSSDDAPAYFSLSCDEPDVMADIVTRKAMDYPVIQVKLGLGGTELDMERVLGVLKVMRQDQLMLADFNGALSPGEAIAAFKDLDDPRIMWEEPCKTVEENIDVARALDQPVMFDQCMKDIPAFLLAVQDGSAAALAIKPAFMGGLTLARTARDICIAAGMKVRIDGPWCGQVGAAAALHVALGAPADLLIASTNLIGPLETPDDMIVSTAPGRIRIVTGPGLGALPDSVLEHFN